MSHVVAHEQGALVLASHLDQWPLIVDCILYHESL